MIDNQINLDVDLGYKYRGPKRDLSSQPPKSI